MSVRACVGWVHRASVRVKDTRAGGVSVHAWSAQCLRACVCGVSGVRGVSPLWSLHACTACVCTVCLCVCTARALRGGACVTESCKPKG